MVHEREKRAILLEPLHRKACDILPALNISQQNLLYYASLANFYTVYDLRNLKPGQTHLYLLSYVWIRYRQFSDNLVDAMFFHMNRLWLTCRKSTNAKHPKSGVCCRFMLMAAFSTPRPLVKSAAVPGNHVAGGPEKYRAAHKYKTKTRQQTGATVAGSG